MVSLDRLDARVHGEPSGEGYSQVVAPREGELVSATLHVVKEWIEGTIQGTDLTPLVRQVVDELAVLAIFASQNFPQLEDGSVDRDAAVASENFGDRAEDLVADDHVLALPYGR